MNIEETNLDKIKGRFKELYNFLISQDYGDTKRLVDGVMTKVKWNITEDFDEIFNYDKLVHFIENGLAKGKDTEWVIVENDDIVEFGMVDISMVQAKYPNMVLLKKDSLYNKLRMFKKSYDNKYQNIKYSTSLDRSVITKYKSTAIIKQKIGIKPVIKKYQVLYDALEEGQRNKIHTLVDNSLANLIPIIVKASLYKKFIGDLKLSLWHIVDEKDSGKTKLLEVVESIIDIYQEDKLSNIFGDRAKVDVASLNAAWLLHQDETTVMFNEFKLLTNSTLKLNLAYAKKQVVVDAPLVIMTSHDDAQDVYSEQFQARVLKIYPEVGSIVDKISDSGERPHDIEAVTYFYVRDAVENALKMAIEEPSKMAEEVNIFVEHNRVEKHDPTDIVKSELYNLVNSLSFDDHGKLLPEFKKYGFELGTKNGKNILVVTGMIKMKKTFMKELIQDKTIYFEISKKMYPDFGFDLWKTLNFEQNGIKTKRQDAWVLEMDSLEPQQDIPKLTI